MNINDVLSNPCWLPIAFNPNKTMLFQRFEESGFADSTFLDNRAKGVTNEKVRIPTVQIVNYAKAQGGKKGINEIFHISHVGSTLLGKLVQSVPSSIAFREPTIFKDLVSQYYSFHTGANSYTEKEMPLILNSIYNLFRRGEKDHVFIKQTSGNLILPVHVDDKLSAGIEIPKRALFLSTSAKDFLSHAITSDGLKGDALQGAARRIGYFNRLCSFRKIGLADLKPLERVALIWLTEMQKLKARCVLQDQKIVVNFDASLRENGKEGIVESICDAFDLTKYKDELLNSAAWSLGSKNDKPFDLDARTQAIDKNYIAEKIQIEQALTWIRRVCNENVTFSNLVEDIE